MLVLQSQLNLNDQNLVLFEGRLAGNAFMTCYYQHHPAHLEIWASFGYPWLHKSDMQGDRYKETHIVTALNSLRSLLDAYIEIVEMFMHVMTASQEQCAEVAGITNTD